MLEDEYLISKGMFERLACMAGGGVIVEGTIFGW
jgi:hypothetical protein